MASQIAKIMPSSIDSYFLCTSRGFNDSVVSLIGRVLKTESSHVHKTSIESDLVLPFPKSPLPQGKGR